MTNGEFEHVRPVNPHELVCPWCGGSIDDEAAPPGRVLALTAPSLDHIQWVHDACLSRHGTPNPGQHWAPTP